MRGCRRFSAGYCPGHFVYPGRGDVDQAGVAEKSDRLGFRIVVGDPGNHVVIDYRAQMPKRESPYHLHVFRSSDPDFQQ